KEHCKRSPRSPPHRRTDRQHGRQAASALKRRCLQEREERTWRRGSFQPHKVIWRHFEDFPPRGQAPACSPASQLTDHFAPCSSESSRCSSGSITFSSASSMNGGLTTTIPLPSSRGTLPEGLMSKPTSSTRGIPACAS